MNKKEFGDQRRKRKSNKFRGGDVGKSSMSLRRWTKVKKKFMSLSKFKPKYELYLTFNLSLTLQAY